ncbi:unnamed protein product [Withania somnifera]
MYLAAIADSLPQPSSIHSQFSSGGMMQPGTHNYLQQQQHQQAQRMATQSLMAARSSSMLYGQQQQQPQLSPFQQSLHNSQLGMSSGSGGSSGLHHMLQSEASPHGGGGGFPRDFSRANKQDIGSTMSAEGRGRSSNGDGGENLYLKASED